MRLQLVWKDHSFLLGESGSLPPPFLTLLFFVSDPNARQFRVEVFGSQWPVVGKGFSRADFHRGLNRYVSIRHFQIP